MPDFQFEKNLVLNYLKELDKAVPESVAEVRANTPLESISKKSVITDHFKSKKARTNWIAIALTMYLIFIFFILVLKIAPNNKREKNPITGCIYSICFLN